jgi:hypothetical protein
MALLKRRARGRWVHPYEAIYLLGLVRTKSGNTPDMIKEAEQRAMETLRHMATDWGIVKVKRSDKKKAGCAFTEESLLAYMERREQRAKG